VCRTVRRRRGRFGETSDFEFGEPDNALFADEQAGAAIQSAVAEAFRQGVIGYAQDVIVQGRPWPFDPRTIIAPMDIVHGALDRAIPMAHSRHTAELVPGSTLRVLPEHGHMTTVSELARMVAQLLRTRS
jgi:pimeloyl-ACP methyl ester carboxylesterase